jgi:hypothetical protein
VLTNEKTTVKTEAVLARRTGFICGFLRAAAASGQPFEVNGNGTGTRSKPIDTACPE